MQAPGASLCIFWHFFDKIWSRNGPEKLRTVPNRERCKLFSEQKDLVKSIGVWRLYLAQNEQFSKNDKLVCKKKLCRNIPPKHDSRAGFCSMNTPIYDKLCAKKKKNATQLLRKVIEFQKCFKKRSSGASLLKHGSWGILNLGMHF